MYRRHFDASPEKAKWHSEWHVRRIIHSKGISGMSCLALRVDTEEASVEPRSTRQPIKKKLCTSKPGHQDVDLDLVGLNLVV